MQEVGSAPYASHYMSAISSTFKMPAIMAAYLKWENLTSGESNSIFS